MESYQSVFRDADQQKAREHFMAFVIGAPPLPFSDEVARECALVRETLRLEGKRVRPRALDLVTAATALFYDLTLVTRNRRDYADIPRLRLYNIEQ